MTSRMDLKCDICKKPSYGVVCLPCKETFPVVKSPINWFMVFGFVVAGAICIAAFTTK